MDALIFDQPAAGETLLADMIAASASGTAEGVQRRRVWSVVYWCHHFIILCTPVAEIESQCGHQLCCSHWLPGSEDSPAMQGELARRVLMFY